MNDQLKKSLLSHGLVLIGFLLITVIVYLPFFTEGKQLSQHDIQQAKGANHLTKEYESQTGENALWNPYMFSGMPAYLTGLAHSGDILIYVYATMSLGIPHPAGITLIDFISFYILLIVFGVRPWIAFAGALAFGLNGFNIISISAGHNAKIAAAALIPLAMAGIHLAFSRRKYLGIGLTALALGLQIRTNHPQMTYYLLLITLIYGACQLYIHWKDKKLPQFGITVAGLMIAAVIAVAANAGKLWTTYEYSKYSIRGKSELTTDSQKSSGLDREYAFRYSNGILEPLFLFIPNVFGGSSMQALDDDSATAKALQGAGYDRAQVRQQIQSMPTYWGDQPLTAPYYAGSIIFLLFILGIIILDKRTKTWLLIVAIIGIVMSWGNNFATLNDLLFDYLPMYNKFRSVTFTILMTIISINLLGFMALEKIWANKSDKAFQKKLLMAAGIAGGFALLLIIGAGAFGYKGAVDDRLPEWLIAAIRADRKSLLRGDAMRTLLFVIGSGALIYAYLKDLLSQKVIIGGFVLLVFIDMISLTKRFINNDSFVKSPLKSTFHPSDADLVIQSSTNDGDRVLNLQNPFNDAITSYFHESVGGYHGAKLRRYQDLISHCLDSELSSTIAQLRAGNRNFNTPVLNMLNTAYFKFGPAKNAVLPNPDALGTAWTVDKIIKVNSADEEISEVCGIVPGSEAVVDVSKFNVPKLSGSGLITLQSRTPNEITYKAEINGNVLGVFSEIYYPKGWVATVDGKKVDILRANYVLRALVLDNGSHDIQFRFESKSYTVGNTISWVGGILCVILFAGGVFIDTKKKQLPADA